MQLIAASSPARHDRAGRSGDQRPLLAGVWTATVEPPHPDEDNEGRIALALDGSEVGYALVIDCADTTLWIDTIEITFRLRGNGLGTWLLALVLALYPAREIGLGAPTAALAAWYGRHGFRPAGPDGEMRRRATRSATAA
jgi:GNAT superfamily N-acetyltransferase